MISAAWFSDDGTMRWELVRCWNEATKPAFRRMCVFVMLNPSTADASFNDPTINRCIAFAKYWGYDGIRVVNLVGFRATKPKDMYAWFKTQSKADLWHHTLRAVTGCTHPDVAKVVLAYGCTPIAMRRHEHDVVRAINKTKNVYNIKLNKDGSPAHPLYLNGSLTPNLHFVRGTIHVD